MNSNKLLLGVLGLVFLCSCSGIKNMRSAHKNAVSITQQIDAGSEKNRLGTAMMHSDFRATGYYMPPGKEVEINVTQVSGKELPVLLVGTYVLYNKSQAPEAITLKAGKNLLKSEKGGELYLKFVSPNPSASNKAQVSFGAGTVKMPLYIKGKTTQAEYLDMLNKFTEAPSVTLIGKRAMITVLRDLALKYANEDKDELLAIADSVITLEDRISGLDGSSPLHMVDTANRYLMLAAATPYKVYDGPGAANATNYRTVYITDDLKRALLTPAKMKNSGWGIWHELGHQHQQQAWTWKGLTEVTVNIYSLAAQRGLGNSATDLRNRKIWPKVAAYLALPDSERDYNTYGDLFGKLCMFHQLWLAYGDQFYIRLHKETREGVAESKIGSNANTYFGARREDTDAKMKYFMLKACTISGNDLTDFFRKWGLKPNNDTYAEILALKLPRPDKDLSKLEDPL